MSDHTKHLHKVSFGGLLIAVGIVFGDIGTSPLYAFSAIVGERVIDSTLVLGGLSAIFWTLMFQTTIKYVIIALSADNNGEGGIFSLYALIHKNAGKWLLYPAIIGGSFLLADGIITPPISVSSAIEGLRIYSPHIPTIPIVLAILILIFVAQQFGTQIIGRFFGPVMLLWFTFIGVIGAIALSADLSVLSAVNPIWVYRFLVEYPGGFWLLGAVFLCTTGAEALYSDMGHVGRANVRYSWIYVKICLLLCYAGQAAHLLGHAGSRLEGKTPFYAIVPEAILPLGIFIATAAAIIASQALISGSFTLVGEAMRLNFWYRQEIEYPTNFKGQLYIPQVNWMLMFGCIGVVLYFQESRFMEAAYGLAVTTTMLMTTLLLVVYLRSKKYPLILIVLLTGVFLTIEISFLIANLIKFPEGGWITVLIGLILSTIMWAWNKGRKLRRSLTRFEDTEQFYKTLKELSNDQTLPQYATHLVYLTESDSSKKLEKETMLSILERTPKRADIYWFLHVETDNDPYTAAYEVETLARDDVYFMTLTLGFRIDQRINYFFDLAIEDMEKSGEVNLTSRHPALQHYNISGDVRFVLLSSFLSHQNELPFKQLFVMRAYYFIRRWLSVREDEAYGLDASNVAIEKMPVVVSEPKSVKLTRRS